MEIGGITPTHYAKIFLSYPVRIHPYLSLPAVNSQKLSLLANRWAQSHELLGIHLRLIS